MKKNQKFIITINRELGSGGRTVGRLLAERLQVPFNDKALIEAQKAMHHLTAEEIEKLKGLRPEWWTDNMENIVSNVRLIASARLPAATDPKANKRLNAAQLFDEEIAILQSIADHGSCVIAGRSAFYAVRNHPNHLNVLIHSSLESRIERVMLKQQLSREEALSAINRVDTARERYMKKYAHTSRYDARNYDLVVNATNLSEEQIVNIILQLVED